jgi:hypothetical protein
MKGEARDRMERAEGFGGRDGSRQQLYRERPKGANGSF